MVGRRLFWALGLVGLASLTVATLTSPGNAGSAASQDWPAFALVGGLLLIGLVADDDRLFAATGHRLGSLTGSDTVLFVGAAGTVGVVTALLNLDTSVAFLTPVLIAAARSRGGREAPLLYGCLLLSNAGSLFLPGSNLTNLIVLGHLHLSGARFLAHLWAPALAALVITAAVVAVMTRRGAHAGTGAVAGLDPGPPELPARPAFGLGLVAVVVAVVLVVVVRAPALPVAAVGVAAVGIRVIAGRLPVQRVTATLGLPVLIGLFGLAVALGTLGRDWSGPATLLSHLDIWGTAAVAAGGSVLVNNLPAASLLSARAAAHPYALLIGLNLGPNLCVTGSLAWVLWWRAARAAGATPSLARAARIGALAVPLSMAAALGLLALTGSV